MEFAFPVLRWLFKGWFFVSAALFIYLLWIDLFAYPWFILLWAIFSLGLGAYVAPAIRVGPEALGVKYLWRYRRIPWHLVIDVQWTPFGAQILTAESNWAYRVVGYQYPMPRVRELVAAIRHSKCLTDDTQPSKTEPSGRQLSAQGESAMANEAGGGGNGQGGIYAILIIIVILILAAVLYMSGAFGGGGGGEDAEIEAEIDISAPEVPGEGGGS
jgi:hypothetical protein